MHEKGVAHRCAGLAFANKLNRRLKHPVSLSDCARFNIMMDASPLYPQGSHPQRDYLTVDGTRWATVLHRYQAPFPKYFLIDFGISTWFKEDHVGLRLVAGMRCQDRTVPKLYDIFPYDPFKVDIYTLGNLFRIRFLEVSLAVSLRHFQRL